MTQAEASLSLREQFELVRERDARMQELMTDAQVQVSSDVWGWGQKGGAPIADVNVWSVPGMTSDNSYYLNMGRWIRPEGATGAKADLDPMIAYFEQQGWEVEVTTLELEGVFGPDHLVRADTGDGYLVSWKVQANGYYNMDVTSKTFWGESDALLDEVSGRTPDEALDIEESVPGVYVPFPEWDDPIVYVPDLLDHSGKGG
ncbi:hypothetical protein [Leucobacter chromiiresistens]|nr:hypothetical protein [Leucobacter chromiiresistens]